MKLFKHSPRYTNALGDACFPKDNLPKLLDALGLLSREVFQAETSWVRVVEQAQQAQVPLDKPQPAQLFFFFLSGRFWGLCSLIFFWRLLSWHPATGSWNSFWHRISSDRFFSLPSVSVPLFFFFFFFFPLPSSDHCLVGLVRDHAMENPFLLPSYFHYCFVKACQL